MNPLDLDRVRQFVNENIVGFHQARIDSLKHLTLDGLLRKKNPYLFKAKNIISAGELMESLLGAYISSSEEKHFGDFLEDLAVFIAGETCGGHKSAAQGVDLEFVKEDTHYVVSIKSGPSWGNSSQIRKLEQDLQRAVIRIKQSRRAATVRPVLGICYGDTRTNFNYRFPGCWKVVGQNFWYLISENEDLYTDIIEPIGYRAKQHNETFEQEQGKVVNRFTREFIDRFCEPTGAIDWPRLVEFNSGNYDLEGVSV
ncbi:MAG: PmeII family type II restriction endonuclease [Chloroflexota bacterium]|nr:PmeII family type II restriction endonuclease [Chloroflexota bacterium]